MTRTAFRTGPLALLIALAVAGAVAGAPAIASAAASPRASLTDIESDVMCTACREPLAVAQSPQADSERAYIRGLIATGETKPQILNQLVAQYGPGVLGKPPAHGFNLTVYVIPLAILAVGAAILARRPPPLAAPNASGGPRTHRNRAGARPRRRAATRAGAQPVPGLSHIASGALTPSSRSDSDSVVRAATDSATRCDSTASGVAPTTWHAS